MLHALLACRRSTICMVRSEWLLLNRYQLVSDTGKCSCVHTWNMLQDDMRRSEDPGGEAQGILDAGHMSSIFVSSGLR